MKIVNDNLCTFCKTTAETIEHLIWNCNVTKRIWQQIKTVIDDEYPADINLNIKSM